MRHVLFSAFGYEVISAPIFAGFAGLAAFLFLRSFRNYMRLSLEDFWDLILGLVLCVPGGAVLFYTVFYGRGAARNFSILLSGNIPGGSFWGSVWTAVAFVYIYCRVKKIDFRHVADGLGLSAMLALSVMRIGCFLHGCCYGLQTGLPWGVYYSDPRCLAARVMPGISRHPTQIYESLGCLAIFLAIYWAVRRGRLPNPGAAFALSITLYSFLRFAVDFTRGGDGGILSLGALTISQLIAATSAIVSVVWYMKYARK